MFDASGPVRCGSAIEGEATMAGSTANPIGVQSNTTEAARPASADVESELRRLVRQRLAPPTDGETATSQRRVPRSFRRRQPIVGAFDSPAGFVFASGRR
jgi:hypothetical protein